MARWKIAALHYVCGLGNYIQFIFSKINEYELEHDLKYFIIIFFMISMKYRYVFLDYQAFEFKILN